MVGEEKEVGALGLPVRQQEAIHLALAGLVGGYIVRHLNALEDCVAIAHRFCKMPYFTTCFCL